MQNDFTNAAFFKEDWLQVSPMHNIHYQESGNPNGVPVILLHGGPGAGINDKEVEAYDPNHYRVITFDQRGAGKSRPAGETRENTKDDLIADIDRLRQHLNVDDFVIAGGSWGTTLALMYAERHPEHVKGIVLRATYLNRKEDFDWMYGPDGVRKIYPDRWAEFISCIPLDKRDDIFGAYDSMLNGTDHDMQTEAASTWNEWPPPTATQASRLTFSNQQEREDALNYARVCLHYFKNNLFMENNEILSNLHKIDHIPIEMVHGGSDMIVLPDGAREIANSHPDARLTIANGAAHSSSEPSLFSALCEASERMYNRLIAASAFSPAQTPIPLTPPLSL